MKESKKETRTLPLKELRVSEVEGGGSVIEGHAAVFDSWSETLGGSSRLRRSSARVRLPRALEGTTSVRCSTTIRTMSSAATARGRSNSSKTM